MDLLEPVQEQYRNFVPFADGYSPCFADWATGAVSYTHLTLPTN